MVLNKLAANLEAPQHGVSSVAILNVYIHIYVSADHFDYTVFSLYLPVRVDYTVHMYTCSILQYQVGSCIHLPDQVNFDYFMS